MPEQSNPSLTCFNTGGPFFRRSTLGNLNRRLSDYSSRDLHMLFQSENSNDDKGSQKYSPGRNEPIDDTQKKLRSELQVILQRAHETYRALKQSAC
jgi:hypothetical protein